MATEMFPGTGGVGAEPAGGGGAAAVVDDGKMVDLRDMIDIPACYARNVSTTHPMSNLFIGDSTLGCKSDTDEQLIIHISFKEFVKVKEEQEEVEKTE